MNHTLYEFIPGKKMCSVCNTVEAYLTTDCPGKEPGPEMSRMVFEGTVDYVDGGWKSLAGEKGT